MTGRNRPRRAAGFTLVELLVALALTAFVLAAAGVAFQIGATTIRGGSDQADAQQNARWALERIVRDLRNAGYDPKATGGTNNFDAFLNPTATSLTIQTDHNGNGFLDAPVGCDPTALTERVRYRLNGQQLLRSTDPLNNTCEAAIIGGVTNLAFTYRDQNGNITATAADIRSVTVTLTVQSQSGGTKPRSVTLTDQVRIRNR